MELLGKKNELDAGYWILDTRFSITDVILQGSMQLPVKYRYKIFNVGYWMLDFSTVVWQFD
jgi:hypothetical protein